MNPIMSKDMQEGKLYRFSNIEYLLDLDPNDYEYMFKYYIGIIFKIKNKGYTVYFREPEFVGSKVNIDSNSILEKEDAILEELPKEDMQFFFQFIQQNLGEEYSALTYLINTHNILKECK